jgi:peroxiredoxin
MVATFCLITCVLAAAQAGSGSEWPLVLRLSRGQELVYTGSFTEETIGKNVQGTHAYKLESRIFVLDVAPRGTEVALWTVLKQLAARPQPGQGPVDPSSIRLEPALIDLHGRVSSATGISLTVPLEGPATIESGGFVEIPRARVTAGQSWEVQEDARPPRTWQVAGMETVNGTPCVKLTGVQQSDDWDHPRADRSAWRRRDTVWMAPALGIAYRVERVVERREPARRDPTQKSVTSYTLDSQVVYPGRLFEDRQREILLVRKLSDTVQPYLPEPAKVGPRFFETILAQIAQHMDRHPATPYRDALLQLQRRVEAARRGEMPAPVVSEEAAPVAPVLTLAQPAPDFVVPNLGAHESARLRRFLGRPILLVFYSPTSRYVNDILAFAQSQAGEQPSRSDVTVLGLAVSDDTDRVLKQRDELRLTFPILSGQGLRLTYAVDATPKFVVLDAAGIVRGAFVGWGKETPGIVIEELNQWKREDRGSKIEDRGSKKE